MNKKNLIIGLSALTVISTCVATYFYFENKKNKKLINGLEQDNLQLILDSIKSNKNLSEEIKKQLNNLVNEFEEIEIKVSNELVQALQLFQIGQIENAIEDLVKIIEHLLKVHYQHDSNFQEWLKKEKKKLDLHNLLTFCNIEKKISEIEYRFYIAVKAIRNKEDHEIDLKLDDYINASGLITAIGGIMKIARMVYPIK